MLVTEFSSVYRFCRNFCKRVICSRIFATHFWQITQKIRLDVTISRNNFSSLILQSYLINVIFVEISYEFPANLERKNHIINVLRKRIIDNNTFPKMYDMRSICQVHHKNNSVHHYIFTNLLRLFVLISFTCSISQKAKF